MRTTMERAVTLAWASFSAVLRRSPTLDMHQARMIVSQCRAGALSVAAILIPAAWGSRNALPPRGRPKEPSHERGVELTLVGGEGAAKVYFVESHWDVHPIEEGVSSLTDLIGVRDAC
jgi:hypothetical protein